MESFRGKLLIASPALIDPNFRRAVVLLTEHNPDGAMGLVLNRPSDATVAEAVPELELLTGPEARVLVGGPVQPEGVMVLAEFSDPEAAAWIVTADVGLVAGEVELEELSGAVRRAAVFAGYAGWGADQLEAELEEGSWIVEAPLPSELLPAAEPGDLWAAVLQRKGGEYALVARMPADPSLN